MRNWILALFLMLVPFGAMAASETINFGDLTPAQIAAIKADIETQKAAVADVPVPEQISEYTIVGQQVAEALIAVAGELGKEVDELLGTTVGKLILIMVIWKVAGADIMGFIVGLLWFAVLIPLWVRYFKKLCIYESEEFYESGKLKERNRYKDISGERATIFIVAALIIAGVGMLVIFV